MLDEYYRGRIWDRLSFRRSAIEPHPQDSIRDSLDPVIDALRSYGEKALAHTVGLIERWWASDRALLRRLALHLVARDASRSPDEVLTWIVDQGVLYAFELKHELYSVLASRVAEASGPVRHQLLQAALRGPGDVDATPDGERHFAYAAYNLLVWLSRSAPDWEEAAAELEAAHSKNTRFAPREHPDFDSWMTSGPWHAGLQFGAEEFAQLVMTDPRSTLDDLMVNVRLDRDVDGPTWEDVLELVEVAVATHPEIGERLWDPVVDHPRIDMRAHEFHRATIEGWSEADLGNSAEEIAARVLSQVDVEGSARAVSRFVLQQVQKRIESAETPLTASLRTIAAAAWREQGTNFDYPPDIDPVASAPLYLNSWPGELAAYWITEVDRRWRQDRHEWGGFNDIEQTAVESLLSGSRQALDAIQPAFARQVFFLFGADSDFTKEKIIPLFRGDATARLAWVPYLYHPRYNDRLLGAGLLDAVIAQCDRLSGLGDQHLQSTFLEVVASIVSFAEIAQRSRKRLLDRTVLTENGSHALGFAQAVGRLVATEEGDGAQIWGKWLRNHLQRRLEGIPRNASDAELAAWADVVPYLGRYVPAALELLRSRPIGLSERFVNPDIPADALSAYGGELVEHYADRVRNTGVTQPLVGYQLRQAIQAMRGVLGDDTVRPLTDAALQKGFILSSEAR